MIEFPKPTVEQFFRTYTISDFKDPRVIKEESDNIVAKLQDEGRDVEYLVLDDEGHGFSKKKNEINVYNRMLDFLEKHQK